jgi:hypothetical protein
VNSSHNPISKIHDTKNVGGVAQVVEYLPRKHEFKPQYCKKKKQRLGVSLFVVSPGKKLARHHLNKQVRHGAQLSSQLGGRHR